ncbi:MAG: ATP-dependent Clp protease ATP-binding subunit [Planctomycetes bacterium]|nr:ATP-dependent Clp protease ATP-binding subunit [Planctomycetota bacterium]
MFDKFTDRARKVIALARQEAERLNNDYIGTEHVLMGLIKEGSGVASNILENLNVDPEKVLLEIEKIVQPGSNTVTMGQLPFTPRTKKMLEYSLEEMRNLGHNYIGTEHLLLGLIRENDSEAAQVMISMGIELDLVRKEVLKILGADAEPVGVGSTPPQPGMPDNPQQQGKSKTPALDAFGRDLSEMAKQSKLDPVIGRSAEIERMLQILCRRSKNNPVLLGEAGVGKTAIVEGLAQRILEGNVPDLLQNKRLVILDLALMVAGTKYRGQFEERIKTVMTEVTKNKEVILFIDELHTLVGAGAAEGSIDASNVLKPALSRGEIQCIGATTLDEYRKYIEKDTALERRFQSVKVDPPSVTEAVEILKGLKVRYEDHHRVTYTDSALKMAAEYSDRYINGRFLPDKAIDVIDESGSRLRLRNTVVSPELKDKEEKIRELERQKESAVANQQFEQAATYRDEAEQIRQEINTEKSKSSVETQKRNNIVDENVISEVVAMMTGIPLTRIDKKESDRLIEMEGHLRKKIIGQDEAVETVAKAVRRSRAGIKNPKRPVGCFLFVGPTGVGKTHMAKALAEFLFGEEDSLIQIDMSEYMEKFNVSKLIGAPPGFVGYEEGGQLTEKVRRRPYSVILLDEIEKAHPDVFNILLQMMEEGRITDSFDRAVDFRNTVVIMTSNVGAQHFKSGSVGFTSTDKEQNYDSIKKRLENDLDKEFRPEFLNRLDKTVVFRNLIRKDIEEIILIETSIVAKRLKEKGIEIVFDKDALEFLIDKGYNTKFGARPLRRAIESYVEDELSELMLRGNLEGASEVLISKGKDGLTFNITESAEPPPEVLAEAIADGN